MRFFKRLLPLLFAGLLIGCESDDSAKVAREPQPIASGEECHLCGMVVNRFPGPKGQSYLLGLEASVKFCSTADLFAWLLQPENANRVELAYVHDMGLTEWVSPSDEFFIPAREALYVVGHNQLGAMGHTLASFRDQAGAKLFIREHGGRIIGYDDINTRLLIDMNSGTAMNGH